MSFLWAVVEDAGDMFYVIAPNLDSALGVYRALPGKTSEPLDRIEKAAVGVAGSVFEAV